MVMTPNPEDIATEDLATAKFSVAISSAHHQFDHHHLRHDDHDDAMESEEKGREGRDGVGLIGELVTLLDWRKPDYCQTYNVTTDSPPWYTPHFAMNSVNRVCAFEPSERETCSHSEILIARRNNSPSRQLSSPA